LKKKTGEVGNSRHGKFQSVEVLVVIFSQLLCREGLSTVAAVK